MLLATKARLIQEVWRYVIKSSFVVPFYTDNFAHTKEERMILFYNNVLKQYLFSSCNRYDHTANILIKITFRKSLSDRCDSRYIPLLPIAIFHIFIRDDSNICTTHMSLYTLCNMSLATGHLSGMHTMRIMSFGIELLLIKGYQIRYRGYKHKFAKCWNLSGSTVKFTVVKITADESDL